MPVSLSIVAQASNGLFQTAQSLKQLVVPVSQPLIQLCLKAIEFGLFRGGQSPARTFPDQLNPPLVLAIPFCRKPSLPDGLGQQLVGKGLNRLLFDTSSNNQLFRQRVIQDDGD